MNPQPSPPPADRLQAAVRFAREAGQWTLRYFRQAHVQVERKQDDSPVTIADREAETLLRDRIAAAFPDDAILGEEHGETPGTSGFRWVLDPIDGTKNFIHGGPMYTTLVAVLEGETPRLGVIESPATSETVYAQTGGGCWYVDHSKSQQPESARVSAVRTLADALLLTSEVASFTHYRTPDAMPAFLELQRRARVVRTWGDGYGYLMVATGRADVMIDPAVNLWDAAAIQPIIEEAGGRFSNWTGTATVHSGEALATNGLLTEATLAVLSSHPSRPTRA